MLVYSSPLVSWPAIQNASFIKNDRNTGENLIFTEVLFIESTIGAFLYKSYFRLYLEIKLSGLYVSSNRREMFVET